MKLQKIGHEILDTKSIKDSKNTSELRNLIENEDANEKNIHDFDGVYIFLSFDIVNSTAYKSLNPYWTDTFSLFREYVSKVMEECFKEKQNNSETEKNFCDLKFHLWKNLGDEVVFMFPNPKISELYKLPDTSWKVLDKICKSLETPTKNSSVKVSVKATLWLAEINKKENYRNKKEEVEPPLLERNINIALKDYEHNSIDFLGPDIDAGFRLSQYASHNKLTIDARLAWILFKLISENQYHNSLETNAKIVAFKVLKGVWNEKPYPIIWYISNWMKERLFYYFEEENSNSIAFEIASKNYSFKDIVTLDAILSDAKQLDYSKYLLNLIKQMNGKSIKALDRIFDTNKLIELHLICLCLNENNEILVLKRTEDRDYLPGKWDFGCTYLSKDNTIEDSLINGYMSKIGTEITILNNKLPIKTIEIDRYDKKTINALVFIGKIRKDKIVLNSKKYSTYKWLAYDTFAPNESLPQKCKEQYVSGFEDRFNDVVQFIKALK